MENAAALLPNLLLGAWLAPLISFVVIVLLGPYLKKFAAYVATGAIVFGCLLSMIALFAVWLPTHGTGAAGHHDGDSESHASAESNPFRLVANHGDEPGDLADVAVGPQSVVAEHSPAIEADGAHAGGETGSGHGDHQTHGAGHHAIVPPVYYAGDWYTLGQFGKLSVSIGYYIDALTVVMFCMVTFIASCIHFYAMGYMHDELHDITDHEVTLADGTHLHRKGRFHRFFQYLSLFCFSMLGIVIAGNIAMTFVFWELVGICSYFLIGFYIERKSASTAANKAFIVNRVGDFGMIIGLMALFGSLGTFHYGDAQDKGGRKIVDGRGGVKSPGIFSLVRKPENDYQLATPDGMVQASIGDELATIRGEHQGHAHADDVIASEIASRTEIARQDGAGYWLLVVAGIGIFCGCVGKSAQFPLHVWLPDAMEGPTPVSALVHSATMVAAGVFLVARFYPVFAPEVLLTIAYTGCITLFIAATIAITASDIKRVLAYSTVSQLGYMMLALGIGGWVAGVFHLFTHAFFKSLLFMCSGSVIHAVHTNDMNEMGGLRKKMPYTAYTMLVGCLAIIGAGIPTTVIGLSGYYSKDAIIEQGLLFGQRNPVHNILFLAAAGGAAITAFYMFRMWYLTFIGRPRNHHRYDHAHESPKIMYVPLVILAALAISAGWSVPGTGFSLPGMIEQAQPAGVGPEVDGGMLLHNLVIPAEHDSHAAAIKIPAGWIAFSSAMAGLLLATLIYCWRAIDANEIRGQFKLLHRFLVNKWWFDELYQAVFILPAQFIGRRIAQFDKQVIDGVIHASAKVAKLVSRVIDAVCDRGIVDGTVNTVAYRTWDLGLALRSIQTGKLRQYVMFVVVGTVGLFVLISYFWSFAAAGQ